MQNLYQEITALSAEFGARTPEESVRLMKEAAQAHAKAQELSTPMLRFANKAGYLEARAAWRARQKTIEARVRAHRLAARTQRGDAQAFAQEQAHRWGVFARAALVERGLQKRLAAAQWRAENPPK